MGTLGLLRRLLRDEEGQSTTEYILITAVVVLVAKKFSTDFQKQIGKVTESLSNNIESVVEEK